jgi:hypothetical protein
MARKGWDQLSPQYKKRLEKSGITESDYNSGVSLQRARGHSRTPEHPHEMDKVKHRSYYMERLRLIDQLQSKKRRVFGDRPRWSENLSMNNIRQKRLTKNQMIAALAIPDEEIIDAILEAPEEFEFFGYH